MAPSRCRARDLYQKDRLVACDRLARAVDDFDLDIATWERGDTIGATINYNVELFDDSTIERMVGHFQVLLETLVEDASQPIGDVPILSARERDQILVDWNAAVAEYPSASCVHELIEAQVERSPDAVAVVLGTAPPTAPIASGHPLQPGSVRDVPAG